MAREASARGALAGLESAREDTALASAGSDDSFECETEPTFVPTRLVVLLRLSWRGRRETGAAAAEGPSLSRSRRFSGSASLASHSPSAPACARAACCVVARPRSCAARVPRRTARRRARAAPRACGATAPRPVGAPRSSAELIDARRSPRRARARRNLASNLRGPVPARPRPTDAPPIASSTRGRVTPRYPAGRGRSACSAAARAAAAVAASDATNVTSKPP